MRVVLVGLVVGQRVYQIYFRTSLRMHHQFVQTQGVLVVVNVHMHPLHRRQRGRDRVVH